MLNLNKPGAKTTAQADLDVTIKEVIPMLDKVIRINMSTSHIAEEKLPESYQLLSGRTLSSRLVSDEVPPLAEPLGPNNKLFITCGLLAGTTVSSANRLSIGAKSPLTGGIKESNAGGVAAYKMGRLGIRAIILEGMPEDDKWYAAVINKEGCQLKEVSHLRDKGVYEKAELLYEQYGKKVGVILIGPAGENLLLAAGITNNDTDGSPSRFSGRGGLGAVMGSKHIIAVILDDTGCVVPDAADKEIFKEKVKLFHKGILENPLTGEAYPKYGTAGMVEITNALGGLPTRNFQTGRFEQADKISGQALYDTIIQRGGEGKTTHACMPGCIIRCSNIYADKNGKEIVSPLEYETISLAGSNLKIDDLDVIAKFNYYCNDYGVDTIEVGAAIGVAMEAGLLPFGDKDGVLKLMEDVVGGTPLGRIIASGCTITGRVFGVRRIPAVKGQSMAAYEPRAIKGTGITYMTSPMGADHTAGNLVRSTLKPEMKDEFVTASRDAQISMSILDGLGLCIFVGASLKDRQILVDLINARFGWNINTEDLVSLGRTNMLLEREFNSKAGITSAQDRLPEHFYEEKNPVTGAVFDITEENLEKMVF